jgi:hypothetical protein
VVLSTLQFPTTPRGGIITIHDPLRVSNQSMPSYEIGDAFGPEPKTKRPRINDPAMLQRHSFPSEGSPVEGIWGTVARIAEPSSYFRERGSIAGWQRLPRRSSSKLSS